MTQAFVAALQVLRSLDQPRPTAHKPLAFHSWPLPVLDLRPSCHAIDGSHAVLAETGPIWVVAVRATAVAWPAPHGRTRLPVEPLIIATSAQDAQGRLAQRRAAAGLPDDVRAPANAEAFAQAWRAIEEMEEARHAIADSEEGALVLVDGALWGVPSDAAALVMPLVEAAAQRGVRLAAVAKRSAATIDGTPATRRARIDAAAAGVAAPWRTLLPDLPRSWVAQLHPAAPQAYRVDLAGPDDPASDEATWRDLAALARDAVYLGYPYPLAVAHNQVAFTGERTAGLRQSLDAAARAQGLGHLLEDPHAMLDRNA